MAEDIYKLFDVAHLEQLLATDGKKRSMGECTRNGRYLSTSLTSVSACSPPRLVLVWISSSARGCERAGGAAKKKANLQVLFRVPCFQESNAALRGYNEHRQREQNYAHSVVSEVLFFFYPLS